MDYQQFQQDVLTRLDALEQKESAREQAEKISDGEIQNQFIGQRTKESAEQRIRAFYQNYDKGSVNSLYGKELEKFGKETDIVLMLIEKYGLQSLQT